MAQTAEVRERLFTMRMSEEEWARADAVAKHFGLNLAGAIRMLLKEKARDVGIEVAIAPPPPSKPASQPRVKAASKSSAKKR